jgi:hypothetical protein
MVRGPKQKSNVMPSGGKDRVIHLLYRPAASQHTRNKIMRFYRRLGRSRADTVQVGEA